jgi:ATP-binding cassette subfamily B protein/subfamily B ATP-binding cassette protein MsbA
MVQASGLVEFEKVAFGYDPDRPVLKRISFRADPGEKIAIVGPSGAGKTTMATLMARFYDPQQGTIRIDGIDIREVRLESLRRNLAMVMQPPLLVGGTIRDNIAFGSASASREQIDRVIRLARLDHVIARMPHGLDETIVVGGHSLSEGEAQRVTIARALLRDAPILIMDEPTSALDIETEADVLAAVEEAMRGRTTLVIAHRLSTIRSADRILVVRDGVLEESGTFGELIARDGFFNHLYRLHTWRGDQPVRKQA